MDKSNKLSILDINDIDCKENINKNIKVPLDLIVNYFTFDNKIYKQNNGAPMHSPYQDY